MAQLLNSNGRVQFFDYGTEEANEKIYGKGHIQPPEVNITHSRIPIIIIGGGLDLIGSVQDGLSLK